MRFRLSPQRLLLTAAQAAVTALVLPSLASAATPDPFFQYTDSTPLADIAPGAILKSRTISVYIAGIKTTLKATQLVYRSTDAKQRPTANVTTIFAPDCSKTSCTNKNKVISYQSFYDSLNPEDGPSRAYAGGKRLPAADFLRGFALQPGMVLGTATA